MVGPSSTFLPLLYVLLLVLVLVLLPAAVDLFVAVAQHAPRETLGKGTQFIVLFALCQLLVNTLHCAGYIGRAKNYAYHISALLVNTVRSVGYIKLL